MGGHARFSPSSGKRRLECPPSLLLEEQFPDEESPFAAEGSAGHAMAEYLINKYLKKRTKRPVSDFYSDELLEAVDDYVDFNITQIEQARKDCHDQFIGEELKFSLAHRINDCFGTADMVVADSHKMEFAEPALMSDEEIAEVLSKADALKKWAEEVYTYAQNEAVVNHKEWPGYKLVLGRSNRKYTDEEDVAEAAQKAGYTDIFKKSLSGITEMERLMGKKKFNEILGSLVYKPDGKVTLVPDSDKREAVKTATAEADFKED